MSSDAFAAAAGALFAGPNIGRDAVYIAEGEAPVLVRIIARRADAVTDFGDARLWSKATRLDLRVAEVPSLRPATGSRSTARPSSSRVSPFATASGSSGPSICDQHEAQARHHAGHRRHHGGGDRRRRAGGNGGGA